MPHIRVKSSQIHSWSYEPVDQVLHVNFLCFGCRGEKEDCPKCKGSGQSSSYQYSDVPPNVWDALRSAESAGSALGEHVKKAGFKFKRLTP